MAPPRHDGSLQEVVRVQGTLLLQVAAEQRQVAREQQFILELPPTARALRELLFQTHQDWNKERPERGAHPLGTLHALQWNILLRYLCAHDKDHPGTSHARRLLADLESDGGTSVIRFNPLGKRGKPPPEGAWYWALRFDSMSSKGRELAETRQYMSEWSYLDLVLRMDRGNVSSLEKQIRELTLGTSVRKNRGTSGTD